MNHSSSTILWKLAGVRLYGSGAPRLRPLDVALQPGVTAVIGASGSGKTSLLNLLVEFERPDAGSLTCPNAAEGHAVPVFWVPQDRGLWHHATVREHLELVMPKLGEDAIRSTLKLFDIEGKADERPGVLSQGERARLAMARALAADAAVLVMDEPLENIHPAGKNTYWRRLLNQLAERNMSLVYSTHMPEFVLGSAERVVCLDEGRMIYEGTVDDLYHRPETLEQAESLGETNWFDAGEAKAWLGTDLNGSIRPERIQLEPATNGGVEIVGILFRGAYAEVSLKNRSSGETRRFIVRNVPEKIQIGSVVSIRVDRTSHPFSR